MWRIARFVLVVAIVLVIVAGVGWHLYGGRWKERYEARVAALRAAGQPTRFEDLATPPIPDAENGAKVLEQAHALLDARRKDSGSAPDLLYKTERTAEEKATLAAYLDSLAPYFELLRQVPERPGWRLDLDWTAGIKMRVDLYSQLSDARQHVVARVEIDPVGDGRTERAAEAAVLMLALAAKCKGPFMVGQLVPESLASDVEEILRIAMRRPGFDAAAFRRVVDPPLARSIPEHGPPRFVFEQERAFMIGAVDDLAAGAPYPHRGRERAISFLRLPDLYREALENLDLAERALARCDTTPEVALAVARNLGTALPTDDPILGVARSYSGAFRIYAD
ncbi:MAG: hypothetical protein ACHQ1G_12340, partial [Planctomycetota bacterium]